MRQALTDPAMRGRSAELGNRIHLRGWDQDGCAVVRLDKRLTDIPEGMSLVSPSPGAEAACCTPRVAVPAFL